jgi:hypothetical protein
VKVSLQEVVVISLVVGVPPGTAGGVIRVEATELPVVKSVATAPAARVYDVYIFIQ